jgi:starch synthase
MKQRSEVKVAKVIGLISGGLMGSDPFDPGAWSGSSSAFFSCLKKKGQLEKAFGLDISKWQFNKLAFTRFHLNRDVWRRRVYSSLKYRLQLEEDLKRKLDYESVEYPVIQLGAYVNAAAILRNKVDVYTYQDGTNIDFIKSGFAPNALIQDKSLVNQTFNFEKDVAHSAKCVLTTSNYLRDRIIEDFGVDEENVVSIGCGINFEMPNESILKNKDYDRKEILFIGKEFDRKGGNLLVNAFKKVKRKYPEAILHIVGPEKLPNSIREISGVQYHGFLNTNTLEGKKVMDALFQSATIFCLPSLYEPFGIAPLEAMSYGIPAIVTDRWALKENIQDNITGYHVPLGEAEQISEKIILAWENLNDLKEMGDKGRQYVIDNFSWSHVVDKLNKAISD